MGSIRSVHSPEMTRLNHVINPQHSKTLHKNKSFNSIGKGKMTTTRKVVWLTECTHDPRKCPGTEGNHEVSQDTLCPWWRSNLVPFEYKSWAIPRDQTYLARLYVDALKTMCGNGYGCSETAPLLYYDIFVNCNWIDTPWQQYSTHLHTNSTQNNTLKWNTQNRTYITIRIHNLQN
jgi:hypothetical protein